MGKIFDIRYLIGLIFVITPSLVLLNLVEVFEFPKLFFITTLLLTYTLYKVSLKTKLTFKVVDVVFLGFVLVYFVSSLASTSPFAAFFGLPYVYSESFVFIFSLVTFLFFCSNELKTLEKLLLFKLFILGSLPVIAYGFVQLFGYDLVSWKDSSSRIFSTFGQPNLLGMYFGLGLVITLWFFLELNTRKYLLLILVYLFLMLSTLSISSFLSFGSVFILIVLLRWREINKSNLAVILAALFVFIMLFLIPLGTRVVKQVNGGTFNGVYRTEDTARIRLILYKSSVEQALSNNLIIGYGPENYLFNFDRPDQLNTTSMWRTDFTKPHNFFIEEFYELGVLGLTFFVFIFTASIFYIKRDYIFVVPSFILINSFFLWPGVFIYTVLFISFYYGLIQYSNFYSKKLFTININKVLRILFIVLLVITLASNTIFGYSVYTLKKDPCKSLNFFDSVEYQLSCAQQIGSSSFNGEFISDYFMYRKGVVYSKTDYSKCVDTFQTLSSRSNNPKYHYYLGLCYEKQVDYVKAIDEYSKATKNHPDYYMAKTRLQGLLDLD